MKTDTDLAIILERTRLLDLITTVTQSKSQCEERCDRIIQNGQNKQDKKSMCTSACKMKMTQKLIASLEGAKQSCKMSQNPEKCVKKIEAKIQYFRQILASESNRYKEAKQRMVEKIKKIPVDMSLKPSKERMNTDILKGKE